MKYIKLFENFKGGCGDSCNQIIGYIETNSTFVLNNNKDEEVLIFTTRENGDVGSDQHSDIDYQEGLDLIKKLEDKFDGFSYSIEPVDEWIDINIKKLDYYKGYEPEEDRVGYVLSYVRSDGRGHKYETNEEFNTYSGREKHRDELKRLSKRFIKDKTPEEVLEIADSLPIEREYAYSEKVLIQKAHNSDSEEWETIPNADFYVARREIW